MIPISADRLAHGSCGRIDVYPVGWCDALVRAVRMFRHRLPFRAATSSLRQEWRYMLRKIRRGDWRAVKRSFNGWLAEPETWPHGLRRCGTGWTRRRALRDLERRVARISDEDGAA